MTPTELTIQYHEQTKHDFHRFARSLGYLDWNTQPDPFRRFAGAPLHRLRLFPDPVSPSYEELFVPKLVTPRPVGEETLSKFLELALGLSAWKEFKGSRWALRMNPSSGNLHPTEGYLLIPAVEGLHDHPAVFHYAAREHALERRTEFSEAIWRELVERFPAGTFFAALTSIHWREAWKYGERAYRYCQHDAGHALACLSISAGVQGWTTWWLDEMGDAELAALTGLDRADDFRDAEPEQPDLLIAIAPRSDSPPSGTPRNLPSGAVQRVASGQWLGRANRLSSAQFAWEIIDQVNLACIKPSGAWPTPAETGGEWSSFLTSRTTEHISIPAAQIIRQRRSAVAMDGCTHITAAHFYRMLDPLLPRYHCIPWSTLGPPACVHLGLFVHLVDGIPPGLYCLVRSPDKLESLQQSMRPEFCWQKPDGCPEGLPLYLLQEGDCRAVAWRVSCDQEIAGAGAFSCGMIAEFEPRLRQFGAWYYRRLFWETGVIGQVLYLEAEAQGVRGTGMGCYYDDPVHRVFGLTDSRFQSLYHFTIGGALEDGRLTTLPPYTTK